MCSWQKKSSTWLDDWFVTSSQQHINTAWRHANVTRFHISCNWRQSTSHHTNTQCCIAPQVTDCFAVDASNLLLHGEDVKQRLGRVFAHAVTGVDHWLAGELGCHLCHNQQAATLPTARGRITAASGVQIIQTLYWSQPNFINLDVSISIRDLRQKKLLPVLATVVMWRGKKSVILSV